MPLYLFCCDACESSWEELLSMKADKSQVVCSKCQKSARQLFGMPHAVFSDPKNSSKWEDFSYRAGFLMDKAKDERRAAEAASGKGAKGGKKFKSPYRNIDDFNLPGVFDKGGVDVPQDGNKGLL